MVAMMSSIEEQRLKKWIAVLNDNDAEMSKIAANKLGEIGNRDAVPHLIRAMQSRTMFVSAASAQALGDIGDKSAVPALIKTMNNHRDAIVQESAVRSLGKLGGAESVRALRTLVESYKENLDGDRYTQLRDYRRGVYTTALEALKQIGSPEALRIVKRAQKIR